MDGSSTIIGGAATRLLEHFLGKKRQRAEARWSFLFEGCSKIKKNAGYLTQRLGGWSVPSEGERESLRQLVSDLEKEIGIFGEDRSAIRALRYFMHQAGLITAEYAEPGWQKDHEAEARRLSDAYQTLLREIDRLLER